MDPAIQPLMAEFGAAVNDAQTLERCLEVILALLDQTAAPGEALPNAASLYGAESTATLGKMVNVLRQRNSLPEGASTELERAIKTRNHLVHAYFKPQDRLVSLTASGTTKLIAELRQIRGSLGTATTLAERILDGLLKKYNLSVEELVNRAHAMYAAAHLEEFHGTRH